MLKLAVILSLCPFKAHGGGLRNLKTLTYLQRMVSLCRYFFLYFAVDPFYSEINATLAVIGRCPFHIRFRKRMAPCEANAPNAVKCTDSLTNSFTSLSCFWLQAEILPFQKNAPFRTSCMGKLLRLNCELWLIQLHLLRSKTIYIYPNWLITSKTSASH